MPRDGLEMLLGLPSDSKPSFRPSFATMRHLPRMLATLARKARYGRRVQPEIVDASSALSRTWPRSRLETSSDTGLLSHIDELVRGHDHGAAYANIVTPLLANAYVAMLRSASPGPASTPTPSIWSWATRSTPTTRIPSSRPAGSSNRRTRRGNRRRRRSLTGQRLSRTTSPGISSGFLERFGHLSDSGNDFSVPPWSEQPDAVVSLAVDHAEVTGKHRPVAVARGHRRHGSSGGAEDSLSAGEGEQLRRSPRAGQFRVHLRVRPVPARLSGGGAEARRTRAAREPRTM